MKEFFDKTGVMAIATRLRILNERMNKNAEQIYSLYDVDVKPKWYPVIYTLLDASEGKTVTQIANEIGHSHVSVVKLVKEMSNAGLLLDLKDTQDKRKTNIFLSAKAKKIAKNLEYQHKDTTLAIEKMLSTMEHNLWFALEEFEGLLDEKSTYDRVVEQKRIRESKEIDIVLFEEKYAQDFDTLNKEWINNYFKLEGKDTRTLEHPKEYIINKGGQVFVALCNGEVAGVCALLKMNDDKYDYELSKMAVKEQFRGKHIGYLLAQEVISYAKELGAKTLFLETNTVLQPAIQLYKKVGFKQVMGYESAYERSNYQMKLDL